MAVVLSDAWPAYKETSGLCSQMEKENIGKALATAHSRYLWNVTILLGIGVTIHFVVVLGLLQYLLRRVVFPLRRVFADYDKYLVRFHQDHLANHANDEMAIIADYFTTLKTDIEGSRSDLGLARGRLTETERLTTVGTLAASIAHEIRSPLTSMRLRLFSLDRTLRDDPRIKDDLAVMIEETKRLDHIIRNFLEFSRSPRLKLARCQVSDLLDQCVELLRYDLKNHNISLDCRVPADLPEIHTDIQQLKQVIINLVNNAVEAIGKDGFIWVTASKEVNPQGEGMVVLRVRDSGRGIPHDMREKMFQPFASTKENGTGLGLSTAKRIMTLHGGDLVLESTSEEGTVFALRMPLEKDSHG
jgi:signal transduction histidine kinase